VGDPDPARTALDRLTAYADAGADCLFAPGVRDANLISAIVNAVAPKAVNVIVSSPLPDFRWGVLETSAYGGSPLDLRLRVWPGRPLSRQHRASQPRDRLMHSKGRLPSANSTAFLEYEQI